MLQIQNTVHSKCPVIQSRDIPILDMIGLGMYAAPLFAMRNTVIFRYSLLYLYYIQFSSVI